MKILVYGCGVIGSFLVHKLCEAGNEVTVVSRGAWKQVLEEKGLSIHHTLQHRDTVDHPNVIEASGATEHYDLVFSIMQGIQQEQLLPELAKADAPIVVLVGNNPLAEEMEGKILAMTKTPKAVLFGFQGTAGVRGEDHVDTVSFGNGSMTIGGVHRVLSEEEQKTIEAAFAGTGYRLRFEDDMEGWLWCHAAFILPMVFLTYALECNLKRSNMKQMKEIISACEEAYGLLMKAGIKIRPKGDEENFKNRKLRTAIETGLCLISKTKLGELCASDHCRHAVTEMEWLDGLFLSLSRQYPDHPMPVWNRMRSAMPSWSFLHETYDHKKEEPEEKGSFPMKAAAVMSGLLLIAGLLHSRKKRN